MAKVYKCANCRLVDVPAEGMLCSACMSSRSGWNSAGNSSASSWNSGSSTSGWGNEDNISGLGSESNAPVPSWDNSKASNVPSSGWSEPPVGTDSFDARQGGVGSVSTATMNVGRNEYRGKVLSVQSYREARRHPSFLGRWMGCLFGSVPFSMKPMHIAMQISMEAQDSMRMGNIGTAKNVHCFADEGGQASLIVPGNTVVVRGAVDRSGVVQATQIYNETSGVSLIGGTSPLLVRLFSLIFIGGLVLMFSAFSGGILGAIGSLGSNVAGIAQRVKDKLVSIICLVILGAVFLGIIKSNPRLRKIAIWIIVFLLVSFVIPQAGPLVIVLFALWFMLSRGA